MKKVFLTSVIAVFACFLLLAVPGRQAYSADVYQLKFASEYPDKHPTVINGFMPWIKKVKELSGGRLVITFFNPNALVPARQAYDSVVAGVADIVASPCHWVHGKFPLAPVIQLPLIFNGAEAASLTTWDLYNEFPEWRREYREVKVLWQWASALFEVHTKKKLIRTLEDLHGKKMIGWNPQIRHIIKELGANPIEVTPHDTYLALERGMADGVICPIAPMKAYKITDAAKYHTIVDMMCDPFYAAVNKAKWNSLPSDLKKILIDTTGDKMARISGKTLDEGSIRDSQWMKAQGHTFYVLPPSEKMRWKKKVQGIHEEWIRKMEKKGYKNARKIHAEVLRLAEKYAKTTVGGYK
ncbi:MAG: TRAP transporter substrate-binding protein [Deltaproteobacteria bacterium]|nr:TRAP transporter substrate-binding protein [Deltaproteobacteria bacterium]MBW1919038.1 TRAP transporter substrate-binding protein [Deltaproteobacteria bacterium]MBW1934530.1 TRAP transporter substrate-binding protein [Deltaproteobacteria bacterium]MBW1977027.1 TRAP transporter substrate-binding protein [Deltaproteobacteria bacterium]MBW2044078.1 TRAP transporter substrate-binding protein [Deltaproteobacteria bacterium]